MRFVMFRSFAISIAVMLLLGAAPIDAATGGSEQYFILHFDGVSSRDFFAAGEAGELPNLWQFFDDGFMIPYGLTLFPGGTQIIYPRLKKGLDNSEHPLVGWGYYDREQERAYGDAHVFLSLLATFPRRSRSQFLTGLPLFYYWNYLYLQNVPALLEQYGAVEFFWYSTDVDGHLFGAEGHRRSMQLFDSMLGTLLFRPEMADVNVILYTDHGMSIGEMELINIPETLADYLGDELLYFSYPNVYLEPGTPAAEKARQIGLDPRIDLTFVAEDDGVVRGFHAGGSVQMQTGVDGYRYEFFGTDPFGYDALGYEGQYLNRDQWLALTRDSSYPGAVPNLMQYMSNPYTGDLVVILNPFKIPHSSLGHRGGHAGLYTTDLLIPVAMKGPQVEPLRDLEQLWLHELYSVHLPMIDFDRRPAREDHYAAITRGDGDSTALSWSFSLSPDYRWRWAIGSDSAGVHSWLAYDIYSSFALRLWAGLAWVDWNLTWFGAAELSLPPAALSARLFGSERLDVAVEWAFDRRWSAVYEHGRGLGLRYRF